MKGNDSSGTNLFDYHLANHSHVFTLFTPPFLHFLPPLPYTIVFKLFSSLKSIHYKKSHLHLALSRLPSFFHQKQKWNAEINTLFYLLVTQI